MKHFLELVAQSLHQKMGNDLSKTIIIFPNKRASLFLNKYLLQNSNAPIWAPQYMSIKEFFCSLAPELSLADPIETIIRLYKLYQNKVNTNDTLDNFYGWGERILSDFEDVDKNMGDAKAIFRDLNDYQMLDMSDEWLDPEQERELKKFVGDFGKHDTPIRDKFKQLWCQFYPLYNEIRNELLKSDQAYEGQLYRYVVEGLEKKTLALPNNFNQVAFVGFNVLDEVEKRLFRYLQKNKKALFYWDYDEYYIEKLDNGKYEKGATEAGTFLKDNLNEFKNELENGKSTSLFNNLRHHEKGSIIFAEADTDTLQTQYISNWLNQPHIDPQQAQKSAIVLCNENMLEPALHALPFKPNSKNNKNNKNNKNDYPINVTKGFPLSHTHAYAMLMTDMKRLLNGSTLSDGDKEIKIKHYGNPLLSEVKEVLLSLQNKVKQYALIEQKEYLNEQTAKDELCSPSKPVQNKKWQQILHIESSYHLYTTLSNFIDLIDSKENLLAIPNSSTQSSISYTTLFKLIRQVMRQKTIPFHGEPAIGLQVMGVLETRCIDFDHILMLSVGEGILPQQASDTSFIPFIIRKHYGLTTYVRKTAVFAYYFYRLLQRAKTVTLVYNSSTSGTQRGEMSRFMRNLLIDNNFTSIIKRIKIIATPHPSKKLLPFKKTKELDINKFTSFSPSALNTYIECPRAFYYKYIEKLKTPTPLNGIIDQRDFGNVFHQTAEVLYGLAKRKLKQKVTPQNIEQLYNNPTNKLLIEKVIKKAFKWQHVQPAAITQALIKKFIFNLLKFDASNQPQADYIDFVAAEYPAETWINVPNVNTGDSIKIRIFGTIDRIDCVRFNKNTDGADESEHLRIIDYKTGGNICSTKNIDELFNNLVADDKTLPPPKKRAKYTFQTFMYCLMIHENPPQQLRNPRTICPALFYINRMSNQNFSPYIPFNTQPIYDFAPLAKEFKDKLQLLLAQIIDPQNQFDCRTDANDENCKYCIYKNICSPRSITSK